MSANPAPRDPHHYWLQARRRWSERKSSRQAKQRACGARDYKLSRYLSEYCPLGQEGCKGEQPSCPLQNSAGRWRAQPAPM